MSTAAPPGIGRRLRQAREKRRLSIEETAWRTRVRPDVLLALEREQFEAFDHTGFVRKHLGTYARFLGLDAGQIVTEYEFRFRPPTPAPVGELERRERAVPRPSRPRWLIAAVLSGMLIAVAAAVGVIGGGRDEPLPTQPRLVPPVPGVVSVRVEALGGTAVTVTVDGEVAFDGTMRSGDALTFTGRTGVEIVADDAGALRLAVDGRDAAPAGPAGTRFRGRFAPAEAAGR